MLSERVKLSVYLPDNPRPIYRNLQARLEGEFTAGFGGASTLQGLDGHYLARDGSTIREKVNVVYTYIPMESFAGFEGVAAYADRLREAAFAALDEEVILIVLERVHLSHIEA